MSKRKQLHNENALFDTVLEYSNTLIVILDDEGRICRFNQACERLSGYEARELEGNYFWDSALIPGDAAKDGQQTFNALKTREDPHPRHAFDSWIDKNGERILVDWKEVTLRNAEGDLEYVVALGTDITSQHTILQALQESVAESRALFEQAAVGIAYITPDGHWIDVNTRLCEILGYERGCLLATTLQEVTYSDDLDKDQEYVEKVLKNEIQTYCMEKRFVRADGSRVWVTLTDSLVRDLDGEPDYFISIIQDISQRKATELLLRNSEKQLRLAQRITHIGSWELDLTKNNLHWSDEIYHIFEIDKEKFDASYMTFLKAIHPDDRNAVDKAYTLSLQNKTPYEISHRLLMPDGRIKWVRERCESEFAVDGTPLHSLGTVQDITEQVRNEQELRELNHSLEVRVSQRTYELANERNFISAILDTVSALVVVLDNQGRVVRINRACEALTGYSQGELLGQVPWKILVTVEQQDQIRNVFNELLSGGNASNYEFEWVCKNGERRLIAWSNSTIKNHKDEVEYVIETGIDITERKATEKALMLARDKAEQANRAKTDFLSRMSHEFRTPLNAILGFSQLLETDKDSPLSYPQHENVDEILHAGNHLLELINEILDLSRVEAGRMNLTMAPVELESLIKDSVSLIQNQAEQRGIRVRLESISPEAQWVLADATRLKQVLLNLLSNAVKYNRDDGHVRINCSEQANGEVRIAVNDSGEGISVEQQDSLFAPFERLDADKRAIPGTGIGLALSKRLTELMGGSIGVESEVGKGSTFWVQLVTAQA